MILTDDEVDGLLESIESLDACKELLARTFKTLNKTTNKYIDIYREKLILEKKLERIFNAVFEEPELTEEDYVK